MQRYRTTWRPASLSTWLAAPGTRKPGPNIGFGTAWLLTREILRDHTSSSYAALAGWTYTPTGAEIAMWDRLELEGRLKRPGYRPWADRRADPLAGKPLENSQQRKERLQRRRMLQEAFHIPE